MDREVNILGLNKGSYTERS